MSLFEALLEIIELAEEESYYSNIPSCRFGNPEDQEEGSFCESCGG